MPDDQTLQRGPEPVPAKSRPTPPPFRPNMDLIGYIEKGQHPPPRPAQPPGKKSRPTPPPFRPNMDLIGYIEKGQHPPPRPAQQPGKKSRRLADLWRVRGR